MKRKSYPFKAIVASFLVAVGFSLPAAADGGAVSPSEAPAQTRLDRLFDRLAEAEPGPDQRIVGEILTEWGKSGSPTVDLLLDRGKRALETGDVSAAIDHLTAAIDYAPGFAEAYHLRANAYYQTGYIGPALNDLRQTLLLEPRHFKALQGIAFIMEELGEFSAAIDVIDQVIALYPADRDAVSTRERLVQTLEGITL